MKRNKMYKKLKFGDVNEKYYHRVKNNVDFFKKRMKKLSISYEITNNEKKDFIAYLKFLKKGIERGDNVEALKQVNEELLRSKFLNYDSNNIEFKEFLENLSLPITDEKKAETLKILIDKLESFKEYT